MSEFRNAMEVFKLLDKSNCRKCNEQTCLAFASAVFLGKKDLDQCPLISPEVLEKFKDRTVKKSSVEVFQETMLTQLKDRIKACDLEQAALRVGGTYASNRLTIRIFGKPFSIDSSGKMFSDIHINPWIVPPVTGYVLSCKGVPLTGKWVPFRELKGGREKNGLFVQRSENALKKIADTYPGLFEDLIVIFNGQEVAQYEQADVSLVIHPLPKLPVLICYWKSEEGMDSDLHLFFDSSADLNADIDIVYGIAAGIVVMFEKISMTHGASA